MTRRLTLHQLRREILDVLDGKWQATTEIAQRVGYGGGRGWYLVALVLERLAHEGVIQLRNPSSRGKRHFRRAA